MSKSSKLTAAGEGDALPADDKLDKEIAALSLEQCFEQLEEIVTALENQTTSLEDAINLFERGMRLSKRCNGELGRMERRVQIIIQNAKNKDEVEVRNFERD